MIIVLRPNPTQAEIDHVVDRIRELGLKPHLSQGEHRTIIGVIGDENKLQAEPLQAIPGVEQVLPIMKPFKLASREFHKGDTVVAVGKVRIGAGSLAMIAGPCAVESREVLNDIAGHVKKAGANILRGGAFKPRTSPYSFQGLGEEGLMILRDVGQKHDMPVVTEVMDPRQLPLVDKYADMLQIGARNMQNYRLLEAVGKTRRPVLLKRGPSATVEELLLAAEYILDAGNQQVMLCERGIRTFEAHTRFTLPLATVPYLHAKTHLPVVVDPSHGTGHTPLVPALARAAIAAGADGLILEVHPNPEKALSDGYQSLTFDQFAETMRGCRRVAEAMEMRI
jgi:3-deoxy-7-phosphoheptulonate synthase